MYLTDKIYFQMSYPRAFQRFCWPVLLAVTMVASSLAAPFRYDFGNSGRYLMVVAKRMDPELFPNDPVVTVMANFQSMFYLLLPKVLSGPEHLERDMFMLFIAMKVALALSLFWLVRCLTKEPLAAFLLLAWSTQMTTAALGGVALFGNVVTHGEIVLVFGILTIRFAYKRLYCLFWALLCLALFIHSLVTIHLLACVLPVVWLAERGRRLHLLPGMAAFVVCFLAYIHWMTPPRLTAEESAIFIRAKGDIVHISPLAQFGSDYVKFFLLSALAILGQRRFLGAEPGAKQLVQFAIAGTIIGLLLAFAAVFGGILPFMQLQPMRIFLWVTLFLHVTVAWSAAAALTEKSPVGWAFLGFILLSMSGSLWAEGCALLAIVGLAVELLASAVHRPANLVRSSRWLLVAFAFVVTIGALSGDRGPLQSLRNPWLLILALGLLLFIKIRTSEWSRMFWLVIGLCLCAAAIGSQGSWRYAREKDLKSSRHDWLAVCNWCRANSAKGDLFVTPPNGDNFRVHALRSCIGEEMSSLAWVSPRAYQDNADTSAAISKLFKNGCWDLKRMCEVARENGARFVVVKGNYQPAADPVFEQGIFSVHKAE